MKKTTLLLIIALACSLPLLGDPIFWKGTMNAALILVREGFEAMLIITAILAYLKRDNQMQHAKVVYTGIALAIAASIGTAFLFEKFINDAGSSREALEGFTMLVAAGVLLYVSYWLFKNGSKQKAALDRRMSKALSSGSINALGLAAFFSVYREGAEVILFYEALMVSHPISYGALSAGIAIACLSLVTLYWLLQNASRKIPMRLFFSATAVFLYIMAFNFIGGGITELQNGGILNYTPINWVPENDFLGLQPSLQATLAQLAFLIPTMGGLFWWWKSGSEKR